MRKTDAHLHVNLNQFNKERLIRYLNRHSFDKCWLLTWEEHDPPVPSLHQSLSVRDTFDLYEAYPSRIVPFYAPDPASENVGTLLESYVKKGLKGCGELKVTRRWEEPLIERYLICVDKLKLPLLFHMEASGKIYLPNRKNLVDRAFALFMNGMFNGVTGYYLRKILNNRSSLSKYINRKSVDFPGYLHDFGYLEKRLIQFPGLNFIGHGPHFWNHISAHLSPKYFYQKGRIRDPGIIDLLLEVYDNFYCDLSGRGAYISLTRDRLFTRNFLNKHAHKLLFGTDNFAPGKMEKLILSMDLKKNILNLIFHENAARIIGE